MISFGMRPSLWCSRLLRSLAYNGGGPAPGRSQGLDRGRGVCADELYIKFLIIAQEVYWAFDGRLKLSIFLVDIVCDRMYYEANNQPRRAP